MMVLMHQGVVTFIRPVEPFMTEIKLKMFNSQKIVLIG